MGLGIVVDHGKVELLMRRVQFSAVLPCRTVQVNGCADVSRPWAISSGLRPLAVGPGPLPRTVGRRRRR